MARRPPNKTRDPRRNGLVLTAKKLTPVEYGVIHDLPHGVRQIVFKALLRAAAELADKKENWHVPAMDGKLRVTLAK